jgi:hypothetical protein
MLGLFFCLICCSLGQNRYCFLFLAILFTYVQKIITLVQVFEAADVDGDGNVDFVEFLKQEWEGRADLVSTSAIECTCEPTPPPKKKEEVWNFYIYI